ncbi:integrase core domain-containing protein, partial [Klebsiella pneumoniae]
KSAQIREILISESAWEEMTCLFAPSLNEHWFSDIVHARKIINDWRLDYNECRPHSSLNYLTPAEFAAGWRNGKYEEKPTDITN